MRFLVDNALSPAVANTLTAAGHDAVHVRDYEIHGAERRPAMQAAMLLANLSELAAALEEGSLVILEPTRVRIRRLPLAGADGE